MAQLAKALSGSPAVIEGEDTQPKHTVVTDKLEALGMRFGGDALLRQTLERLLASGASAGACGEF